MVCIGNYMYLGYIVKFESFISNVLLQQKSGGSIGKCRRMPSNAFHPMQQEACNAFQCTPTAKPEAVHWNALHADCCIGWNALRGIRLHFPILPTDFCCNHITDKRLEFHNPPTIWQNLAVMCNASISRIFCRALKSR